jgi:hypothetical protein
MLAGFNRGALMFASAAVVVVCSALSMSYGRPPPTDLPPEETPGGGGGCQLCAVLPCDSITGCDGDQLICDPGKQGCCCGAQGSGVWDCACQDASYCTSPPSGTMCR